MTALLDIFLASLADALDLAGFACEQTAHAAWDAGHAVNGIRRRLRTMARGP